MRVWIVLWALCGAAYADGADPKLIPAPEPKPAPEVINFSHQGQIAISVRFALGYRALAPYNDEYCGQTDASGDVPVCTGRAPFSIDFELAYGIRRKIDAMLEMRLGIEQDFGMSSSDQEGARVLHFSPGARFFFSDAGKTKLFTTAQLVFDVSGYKNVAGEGLGTDIGVRNMSGLWVDLDRAYGFYAYVGETATFARWLRFELEAGIGLQGRYR
jgi:hypothetical protein